LERRCSVLATLTLLCMYQGSATLLQKNPRIMRVFWGGGVVVVVAVVVALLLPGNLKWIMSGSVFGMAFGSFYISMLQGAFKPKQVPVNLYVDQTGIYADNAPLARREDITTAYIRPAFDARMQRISGGYGTSAGPYAFRLTLPGAPLTVEVATRSGPGLAIDPGGEGPAGQILTALGIPVTTCPPGYRPPAKRSSWVISAVIVVLFLAVFFGYYLFMVYKTMHRH
jgi:hypothetical protein